MRRWKQYGGLAGLLTACFAAGLWGFTATGGALPYAKRFTKALQRGTREGGGPLLDLGRGVVVAGPIRKGGLVAEFAAIFAVLAVGGLALYVYADRYRGRDDRQRSA